MSDRRRWPFHPKYLGLVVAVAGFAFAIALVPLEVGAPQDRAAFLVALRTLLSFLGGSGFTAWLSMSIYEHVHARGQERAWTREFSVQMVRDLYGPAYDELQTIRSRLPHMTPFKGIQALMGMRRRYLSLLVPTDLVVDADFLLDLIAKHNRIVEIQRRKTQARVESFASEYLGKRGMSSNDQPRPSGAESRHILGGGLYLKDHYAGFLSAIGDACAKHSVTWDAAAFDRELREAVQAMSEAKAHLAMRKQIEEKARNLMRGLEPLIRRPYE